MKIFHHACLGIFLLLGACKPLPRTPPSEGQVANNNSASAPNAAPLPNAPQTQPVYPQAEAPQPESNDNFGGGVASKSWSKADVERYVDACSDGLRDDTDITKDSAEDICECISDEANGRWAFNDFVANIQQYTDTLDAEGRLDRCIDDNLDFGLTKNQSAGPIKQYFLSK
jgi:hypothetical protein